MATGPSDQIGVGLLTPPPDTESQGQTGSVGAADSVPRRPSGPIPPAPTPDAIAVLVRSEPPHRDLVDLAWRMGRTAELVPRTVAAAAPARSVGDRETFWVHDIVAERYFEVPAVLEAVTDAAYFWVQQDRPFDAAKLQTGATEFSTAVIPDLRRLFGDEWNPGVDLDPRMHVLHHEPIRGVAGYYSSTDEFTEAVEPHSNEREMFYINMDMYEPGSYDWIALLAHEFQHMIHWHADPNESVWANEGLSELASTLAGYPNSSAGMFFREPGTPLLEWNEDPNRNGPDYAASLAFFTYVVTRFGDDAIRSIVAAEPNGPAGIEAGLSAIGRQASFDDLFMDWVVANMVDDPTFADGQFSYRDRPLESVQPLDAQMATVNARVAPYGTDYYNVTTTVADGVLDLNFEGDARIGLLEARPSSTGAVWWSGRGDGGDSRLTGGFDLSGVTQASLAFRMWHALETNWDFAYFLASKDDGVTWQRLVTARTTDADPNGNNYGAGLTGASDGWVDEQLDLTPYVGGKALVRFETVTDDAVSLSGVALDDLRLDAIGFTDDAEDTDPVWAADGFMRLMPTLSQRWGVQAVVSSGGRILQVERPAIDADGRGRIRIADIPGAAQVTLAVSSLTPGTRQLAVYRVLPAGTVLTPTLSATLAPESTPSVTP